MQNDDMTVNQEYLLREQYQDASNFDARLRSMQRMGITTRAWYERIFRLLPLAAHTRVLELGCGPGYLWQDHVDRLPEDCEITLSDFSPGMLQAAQDTLRDSGQRFRFQRIDAQAIPFAAEHFDVVIANLMLYHVPDRPRALSEIARVLKSTGHFLTTTFSQTLLASIEPWIQDAGVASWIEDPLALHFSLENGAEQLSPWFAQITLHPLENTLVLTDAQPLVELIRSGTARAMWDAEAFHQLHLLIEQAISQHGSDGSLSIPMPAGLFDASHPIQVAS